MSIRVLSWAWDAPCANSGEKLVLLALADHAGDDAVCWPSTARITDKTGLSDSTVRLHLERLEARGLITRERRRRRDGKHGTYTYTLGIGPPPTHRRRSTADPSALDESTTADPPAPVHRETTADPSARRTVIEPSYPPGGAEVGSPCSSLTLMAAYCAGYGEPRGGARPPSSWLMVGGRHAKQAIADGLDPDALVRVFAAMGRSGTHPKNALHVYADFLEECST